MSTIDTDPLFGHFSSDERTLFLQVGYKQEFDKNTIIFKRGEYGNSMYFIEKGQVEILFEDGYQGKYLKENDYFGEISLLSGGIERTATAVVREKSCLRVIPKSILEDIYQEHPDVLCTLLQKTCAYLVQHEQTLITDLKQKNKEITQILDYLTRTQACLNESEMRANTDDLTGLYNQRCLNERLTHVLPQEKQENTTVYLVLFDLDYLKALTDTYGHSAGDIILKCIAQVFKKQTKNLDLPCFIGKDSFALLMLNETLEIAQQRIEALRIAIADLVIHRTEAQFSVTVTLGAVLFQSDMGVKQLRQAAEKSLYEAKRQGRNRIVWFHDLTY